MYILVLASIISVLKEIQPGQVIVSATQDERLLKVLRQYGN